MLFYIIMDFYNSALFLIIFVVLFTTFYIILSNFGYSVSFNTSTSPNIEETITNIQSKVNELDKKVENKSEMPLTEKNKYILVEDSNTVDDDTDSEDDTIMSLKSELNSYKKLLKQKNNHISKLKKNKIAIKKNNLNSENIDTDEDDDDVEIVVNKTSESKPCQKRNVFIDPIANYDNAKLGDPLVDPLQRTSADQIPNPSVAMQFNFPTQGVLDKYHRVGLLIAIGSELDSEPSNKFNKSNYSENSNVVKAKNKVNNNPVIEEGQESKRDYKGVWLAEHGKIEGFGNITADYDNSILELIGKRRYHNVYRYFTSITMGNKIIKVMVHNRNNKELYSGDVVFIKELGKNYRVEIDNMDMIEYNPYVI